MNDHQDHEAVDDELAFLLPPIRQGDKAGINNNPWLNPWMGAGGPKLLTLLEAVRRTLAEREEARGERQRARRAGDQEKYDVLVEVMVSNLARAALEEGDRRKLNVVTGRKTKGFTRYENKALGKPLVKLVDALGSLRMLERQLSYERGTSSWLRPTELFTERVRECGITKEDFRRLPAQEVIVLRERLKFWSEGEEREITDLVNYDDTSETNRMRAEMRHINDALGSADILFIDDGESTVDIFQRTLRRVFVMTKGDPLGQRFDLSGRLYGGFWMGLKRERRGQLRIEGESVADLDYSAMFLRLAYARLGVPPPEGDPYVIPGLEGHRPVAKIGVNAALFADGERGRWPRIEDVEDRPPKGYTWSRFLRGLALVHPQIMPLIGTGLGLALMHLESEILVKVLLRLTDEGAVALPMHDGLMVQMSKAGIAKVAMEEVAREETSADIPVRVKLLES